ncbi:Maf family protein [Paenibacillus turicensis]|uniref:Maf family protein n=1 Tax=Paenibacillus turicensis TaxID=160487 RepID=UPI003D2BA205
MNSKNTRPIILASTSPRRSQLLSCLELSFTVIASHADEQVPESFTPEQVVHELSSRKAESVYTSLKSMHSDAVIIGSDTIVVRDGTILGKPQDVEEAANMLTSLQGRSHQVWTGVTCLDGSTGEKHIAHCVTTVTMKSLSESEIQAYASSKEGLDKAGGYGIQGLGASIVTGIEGCYFNVVGLPLSLLSDMLKKYNIHVLA